MIRSVFTTLLIALYLQVATAFHFYLGGDTAAQQCFFMDLHEDTVLVSKHSALEFDEKTKTYTRPSTLALLVTIDVSKI